MATPYDIDFKKLTLWNVPNVLRKPRMLAWLWGCVYPFVTIHIDFLRFRKQKLYELSITPQVCFLEKLLNDRFDATQRRIVIVDAEDRPPLYLYINAENRPLFLGSRPLYTNGEAGTITDDFIVKVPAVVSFDNNELNGLLKRFKLAGTKHAIQIV